MLIIIIVQLTLLVNFIKQYSSEQKTNQTQEETIRSLQRTVEALQRDDIQRLIEHVKNVMSGDIVYERSTNPLALYSYHKELYPTMNVIEMELNVMEIHLNENYGRMKVIDSIRYLDSLGRMVRGNSATSDLPTIWTLEKQEDDWVIVDIVQGKLAQYEP